MTNLNYESVPNFDAMEADDLMSFWARFKKGASRADCAALFGGEVFDGYTRAANDLANYASNKATAMSLRLRGEIGRALLYEDICDAIYKDLPAIARW